MFKLLGASQLALARDKPISKIKIGKLSEKQGDIITNSPGCRKNLRFSSLLSTKYLMKQTLINIRSHRRHHPKKMVEYLSISKVTS